MTEHSFDFTPQKTGPGYERGNMTTRASTLRVMIHCTADPEGSDKDYDDLWRVHVTDNDWSDIGYHWALREGGEILECRKEHLQGAGCSGQNHDTIHISYFGGMNSTYTTAKDTMTPEQDAAMVAILLDIKERYPDMTVEDVVGHNQFAAKACPSFDVATKMPYWQGLAGEIGNPEPNDPDMGAIGLVLIEQDKRIKKLEGIVADLLRWKNDE